MNEYDEILSGDADRQRLRQSMYGAVGTNPDQYAEARRIGQAVGVPADVAARNPEEVKRKAALNEYDQLLATSPKLAKKYGSDPEFAKLAHDDAGTLSSIEQSFRQAEEAGRAVRGQVGETFIRRGRMVGEDRSFVGGIVEPVRRGLAQGERGATLLDLFPGLRKRQDEARQAAGLEPSGFAGKAARMADQQRRVERFPVPESIEAGMQEISGAGTFGEAASAALRNPRAVLEVGLQSFGASAPGLVGAIAGSTMGPLGTAAGAGMGSFAVEYANTIQDVMAERGVDGKDAGAVAAALSNPELMAAAREKGLKRGVPIAMFDALTAGVAGRLLAGARGTVASVGTRAAGELAIQAGGGAAGEAVAQAATGEYKPGDILLEAIAELPTAVVEVPANYRSAMERAEAKAVQVEQIAKLAEASKLKARDPQAFREFIARAAETGEGPAELFIDAEQLTNTLNQSAVTLAELRAIAPTVADQLASAVPGADIRVPVAEFAAAPSEITATLIDHLRESPEAMSRAEAQEFMKTQGEQIQRDVESALQQQDQQQAFRENVAKASQHFEEQLNAVGRARPEVNKAYATVLGNFYASQAQRAGLTVDEFMDRYRLRVSDKAPESRELQTQQLNQEPAAEASPVRDFFVRLARSVGLMPEQGIPQADATTAVQALQRAGLGNLQLVESVDQLPESAQRKIRSEGAQGTRGLYDPATDTTYLVRSNIADIDEAFWVGLHEAFHRGLRKTVGPEVEPILTLIHDGNERVRTLTERYMAQHGIPKLEAIEEVLADMAGQGEVGNLAGWDQLLAFLKQAIAKLAQAAGVQVEITDQQVVDLVAGMRRAGMQDRNTVNQGADEAPPLGSLSFADDITSVPTIMALLEGANLSTVIHESGHWFLEVQADLATRIQRKTVTGMDAVSESERQIVADMEAILAWFGVEQGESGSRLDTWSQMSLEEKRDHHETFARGFERYAMEGKAPSQELQGIFSKFRAWLMSVYRALKALNVDLSDEVRQVMDRMLASDEAIAEAQMARAMGPLFQSPEQAGMTPEEFAAYQALGERQTAEATAELDARLMKDMKWLSRARAKALKEKQAEVDGLRREIRMEVRAQVMSSDIYRAWQFLTGKAPKGEKTEAETEFDKELADWKVKRTEAEAQIAKDERAALIAQNPEAKGLQRGQLIAKNKRQIDINVQQGMLEWDRNHPRPKRPEGATVETPPEFAVGKLDAKAVAKISPEAAQRLKDLKMTRTEDGMAPDVLAEQFHFESGQQLVNALLRAPDPSEVIDQLTDQQMLERHGDIASPEALARAADEAVHNALRARVIAAELKALEKANKVTATGDSLIKQRDTVDLVAKAAEEHAARVVGRMRLKDLRPKQYAAAEARSGKLAAAALGKNLPEAAMHKRNQLVNNFAAKAAYEAQAEAKKAQEFFRKVISGAQDKVAKTRDYDVVQAARAILADYGIGSKGEKAQAYLDAVQRNDPAMYQVLRDTVDRLTANAKPANELTVEEFRGLVEEIQALWHMAKRSRQVEIDGQLIDIETAKIQLTDRLEAIGIPDRVPGQGQAVTEAERRVGKLQSFLAALRRVEQWVDAKDGSTPGPFRAFVWQPIRDAADRYRTDKARFLKRYRDLLDNLDLPVARIDATQDLGYTFGAGRGGSGKAELLHALLHTGNASNKRKLLLGAAGRTKGGQAWATVLEDGTLDTGKWDRFINRMIREGVLTKADFDFVQGVWDLLEEMKPLAQKAHRDVFGRYFDEVTADAFTTPFGSYRGGYVPAMTDAEIVKDAATRKLQEEENSTLSYAFPSTPKGFTKARVEYNAPLLLDLRVLGTHIDKVLLFSHLERPIRDVRKILTSKEVSTPLHKVDPSAFDMLLTPWMNRAARQSVESQTPGDNGLMRFFSKARSRAGMAVMFANVVNTAQQITGFSIAALRVDARYLRSALVDYVKAPRQFAQAVADASPYMATRMENEVAQMNDAINEILLNPSLYEKAQAWTAKHAYFMQSAVDNVMSPIVWTGAYNKHLQAGRSDLDARRLADAAVRQTQGSSLPEDIASFEGGGAVSGHPFVRLFTQFASYFNMQANTMGTDFAVMMREQGLRAGMGKGLFIFMMGFYVPAVVSELIVQASKGGPDDEDDDGVLDDWLAALFLKGPLRSALAMVPVAGQIANAAINTMNSKPYDDRISTAPAISLIESAARSPVSVYKAVFEDGDGRKAVRDLATLISLTVGLPAFAISRPVGYLTSIGQDKVEPTGPADAVRGLVTGVPSPDSKQ